MPPRSAVDVLIVGAGPTGLTAAAELAARGISHRLIDKLPEPNPQSRALVVQARTLELFAKLRLADKLLAAGKRGGQAWFYVGQKQVAGIDFAHLNGDTAYPFLLFVSQADTERVLTEHLASLGGAVERGVELMALEQTSASVTARLRHPDGALETLAPRYVIGCDGAHSLTRKASGATFKGSAYPQDFVLADVDAEWELPQDRVHVFLHARGLFTVLPLPGQRAQRLICSGAGSPGSVPPEGAPPPTLAEVQALADALCGFPIRVSNPRWLARFHLHHRGVDHYRNGALFLAGDAAHIHSPAGGQGMNTGIQDAFNLCWKLALVLRGDAPDSLLDSYHAERFPVGQDLLRFTDRLFSMGASQSRLFLSARKAFAPRLLSFLTATPAREAWLFRFVSELGISYRQSPIVAEDFGDGPFRSGPKAGERAPDGWVRTAGELTATTLHAELTGIDFQLLIFAGDQTTAEVVASIGLPARHSGPVGVRLHVVTRSKEATHGTLLDEDGSLHARYGVSHGATYLIRPDGYIAFRAPRIERAEPMVRLLGISRRPAPQERGATER